MSTKIYPAVRFPAQNLNQFLDMATKKALALTVSDVKRLVSFVPPEKITEFILDRNIRMENRDEEKYSLKIAYQLLVPVLKERSRDLSYDNQYNLQSGWSFFFHDGFFYAVAWGNHCNTVCQDLLKDLNWVEDYVYWDNTDRSEGISEEQWAEREKNWEAILEPDEYAHRLRFYTVDFESFQTEYQVLDLLVADFEENR